uniref:Complement protein 1S n=1 Tax=Callorhinchus milii TaxID=7868 RepID=V9KLY1_CALMI
MRLLALALLPPLMGATVLEGLWGQFSTPGYPRDYPDNLEEVWEVRAGPGYRIRLSLTHVDVERSTGCAYDYIEVESDEGIPDRICGKFSEPLEFESRENWMTVRFRSDFSNEEPFAGFRAVYSASDKNECLAPNLCRHNCNNFIGGFSCSCRPGYHLQEDGHVCSVNCSREEPLTRFSGTISSPGFPGFYPENSRCRNVIRIEEGFQLILSFSPEFDIEGDGEGECVDTLKITDARGVIGVFCGRKAPEIGRIDGNFAALEFTTNPSGHHTGWSLRYSSTAKRCRAEFPDHSSASRSDSEFDYRETVDIRCQTGYELLGPDKNFAVDSVSFRCQKDGTWKTGDYHCKPVDCGPPDPVANGATSYDRSTFLSRCAYKCDAPHYTLDTTAEYICSSSGYWVNADTKDIKTPNCRPVCGLQNASSSLGRIVGGGPAAPGQFPWMVRIVVGPRRTMGAGALVGAQWVLTAAHLFDQPGVPRVTGGMVDLQDRQTRDLVALGPILHPGYRPQGPGSRPDFDHDLCLIPLRRPVKMGPLLSPVCLPPGPQAAQEGRVATVAGWGRTETAARRSKALRFARVPLAKMAACAQADYGRGRPHPVFTDNMLCAGAPGGRQDTCQGDSGGPLVLRGSQGAFVAGVTSFGPPDCGGLGVYTHVGRHLDWIEETMRAHQGALEEEEE